jgi:hypothetical protein
LEHYLSNPDKFKVMDKVKVLLICALFVSTQLLGQFQLGQTIFDSFSSNFEYNNIDVNHDGSVFVAGNKDEGEFKVFEIRGNEWRQKGQTISAVNLLSVIISEDGNTVVANERMRIGVYRWDGIQWNDSKSPELNDRVNFVKGISASGSCTRICMTYIDSVRQLGVYEVFEWEGDDWNTLGNNITIENPSKYYWGKEVELSGDGSSLITSYFDLQSFYDQVEVFKYSGTDWVNDRGAIVIDRPFFKDGRISISHDGNTLAIANTNVVNVIHWDGQNWVPKGDPIPFFDLSEGIVELDGLGSRIAFSDQFLIRVSSKNSGFHFHKGFLINI